MARFGVEYFSKYYCDESGGPPSTFYLSLNNPLKPVHAHSLELHVDSLTTGVGARRLEQLKKRLIPLVELRDVEFDVSVKADSTGIDSKWNQVQFTLDLKLETAGAKRDIRLEGIAGPLWPSKGCIACRGEPRSSRC